MRAKVKKVDKAQLQNVSVRQDIGEKICRDSDGVPIWAIPEPVTYTYTIETDGERGFDWLGVRGNFYKFNRE